MDHISYENRTYNFTQYIHYILGIEKQYYEIDEKTKEKKYFYNAFLLINAIINEQENIIQPIISSEFYKMEKSNKLVSKKFGKYSK